MPSLSSGQFAGPYSEYDTSATFRNVRRFDGALADAPPFPSTVQGRWSEAKGAALDTARTEWRQQYGQSTPTGPVHPNAVQRTRSGTHLPYDPDVAAKGLRSGGRPSEVDPRTLHGVQQGVRRQGVEHYLSDAYEAGGQTFESTKGVQEAASNRIPVVYQREDGLNVLLSGHHRAAASLAQARPLVARTVKGPVPRD